MQYQLDCPDEIHVVQRKLLVQIHRSSKELNLTHTPTYTTIINAKIALLKEILGIIENNSNITEEELLALVDHKLETEGKALDIANNIFDTDRIFTSVRILEWIKYLIIENNGRLPSLLNTLVDANF